MSSLTEQLAEALAEELRGLLGEDWAGVVQVKAPRRDLVVGKMFRVTLRLPDRRRLEVELPCGLALGYLGDEENAVDAWKRWAEDLAGRIRSAGAAS